MTFYEYIQRMLTIKSPFKFLSQTTKRKRADDTPSINNKRSRLADNYEGLPSINDLTLEPSSPSKSEDGAKEEPLKEYRVICNGKIQNLHCLWPRPDSPKFKRPMIKELFAMRNFFHKKLYLDYKIIFIRNQIYRVPTAASVYDYQAKNHRTFILSAYQRKRILIQATIYLERRTDSSIWCRWKDCFSSQHEVSSRP